MALEMFTKFSREEWRKLHRSAEMVRPINELQQIVSINEDLTQEDIQAIYVPIVHYIDATFRQSRTCFEKKRHFYGDQMPSKVPFIIGISGSVAVGKSTTARLLRELLQETYPEKQVKLMTTDGFLYPNAVLKKKGLMKRKGFPESYDMEKLLDFMTKVKTSSEEVEYPLYSHEIYDVLPGETHVMKQPDILIVEGINVLQLPPNFEVYVSDFFDLSIFVDADSSKIREWFMQRFEKHLDHSQYNPGNYYYPMTKLPRDEVLEYAKKVWYTINYINLQEYILPTRNRANMIIHKTDNHYIDEIYIRKY